MSKDINTTANSVIWDAVFKTDPRYVKEFSRGGGFKGTAINATWLARKATETFGPIGIGWGLEIVEERMLEGAPILDGNGARICNELIHCLRVKLWYVHGGQRGEVIQFGQTTFVSKNKYGVQTDEEAPKKSLTDAMSKCLSLLGFASDVHMGLWDDNKYVASRWADVKEQAAAGAAKAKAKAEEPKPEPQPEPQPQPEPKAEEPKGDARSADEVWAEQLTGELNGCATMEQFEAVVARHKPTFQEVWKRNNPLAKTVKTSVDKLRAQLSEPPL
jgi:hypothetical protein